MVGIEQPAARLGLIGMVIRRLNSQTAKTEETSHHQSVAAAPIQERFAFVPSPMTDRQLLPGDVSVEKKNGPWSSRALELVAANLF